ncbi:MAG: (Fe-S)-binding protein [Deltaproteobacteria bacterium]|nr:(Fe-S)-binding protein [Deltaproteobacteria bacterium]
MPGMKMLAELMRELEHQLGSCMRCGMCQAVCPLFSETGLEGDVARGKLALLDGLLEEMFNDPKGVVERLSRCLLCGSCAANCPSGAAWGSKFQKIFTRPANELIGTSCARFVSPLIGNRHFTPLAKIPFHRRIPSLNTNKGRSGIKVAFYVGCLLDKSFPHIAQDVVDVLQHHGVGIFMPKGQGCCGIPAISSGDTVTFNRLVRHNLEIFDAEEFDYLVTACATCTSTIKEIWPMMADKNSGYVKTRVAAIAQKTLDIQQFLVSRVGLEKLEAADGSEPVDVTYHDPCHLKKSLGVSAEPRSLINANPAYRLIEMSESDRCCGLGGSFNLAYYDLSANIGNVKMDHIRASGCSMVATGCPACMLQISDMLSRSGGKIRIKHPIEIYAELLKNLD